MSTSNCQVVSSGLTREYLGPPYCGGNAKAGAHRFDYREAYSCIIPNRLLHDLIESWADIFRPFAKVLAKPVQFLVVMRLSRANAFYRLVAHRYERGIA
jgi:hypothetical protein